jgi:protein TonB
LLKLLAVLAIYIWCLRKVVIRAISDGELPSRVMMQMRILVFAGLVGLLLVSAIPSYAQTDGLNAQTSTVGAWKKKIVAQLMRNKGSPPPGATGQSGKAIVKFAIDRQGKLISRELVKSTGSELLDAAAIEMVERTEPFPVPPAEVSDDMLTFTVPVIFVKSAFGRKWVDDLVEEQTKLGAKMRGICRGC